MTHTLKFSTLRTLSLPAALAAAMVLAGCEKLEVSTRQGDREVEKELVKADVARDEGGDKATEKVIADLKAATAVSNAGPGGQIEARSELAREEFERALSRLPQIKQRSQQVQVALWSLDAAAGQLQGLQAVTATYAKTEPKEALDQVEASRGEANKAIEKAKADATAAQGELDKRQKEIDELKGQRTAAENEAEQLAAKSKEAKGKESVDLFKQSTEARTKAGTLAAQIEVKTAALLPFKQALEIAQGQEKFWSNQAKEAPGVVQQLDERKAQVQSGWQDTQSQIQAINDVAKKILADTIAPKTGEGKAGQPAHMNPAATVVKLSEEAKALRDESAKDLEDAIKNYDAAAQKAKTLRNEIAEKLSALQAKPGNEKYADAFKLLSALYDENNYLLGKGRAEMALANLQADAAVDLRVRATTNERLAKALQGVNLQLPADLSKGATANDVQAAVTAADTTYQAAEKTLDEVAGAQRNSEDLQQVKNAGLTGLLNAHYGRYQLTGDEKLKEPLKLDIARAKEAQAEIPPALRNFQ